MTITRKFTPEVFEQIRLWVQEGLSKAEIAERLDSTPNSLQANCSKRGISLRRNPRNPGTPRFPKVKAPISERPVPIFVTETTLNSLRRTARALGVEDTRLATELLEVIARDDLFNAVLDKEAA